MATDSPVEKRSSIAWPIAVATIAVAVIVSLTTLAIVRQLARLPHEAADQAREAVSAVLDLAAAFHQGSATTRFRAYVTSLTGTSFLQVATVDRVELFTREDRASILWGNLQLPDVVVSASAPVQYTAYVDLDEPWELELEDGVLTVVAPPIRFNRPSIDVANVEFEIEADSLLRDEQAAIAELERELTSRSHRRARDLIPTVRETAREQIRSFVSTWVLQAFPDSDPVRVEVLFADELGPRPPVFEQQPSQ